MSDKLSNFHILISVENDQIRNIYWLAEQKYRKNTRLFVITTVAQIESIYLLCFIYAISCICTGYFDASTWPMSFELSVPFDTKSILGWYLLLFFTNLMDTSYMVSLLWATTQFFGYCIYIEAICKHFDLETQMVQANIEKDRHENTPQQFSKTKEEITVQFRKAIHIHVSIYE